MKLKTTTLIAVLAGALLPASSQAIARESRLLDSGWKFSLLPDSTSPDSTSKVQPFSKTVDLPHDWSIGLPFDAGAPSGNDGGYVCTGKGTYQKDLNLTAKELDGSKYSLLFEGVYERWTLKVNGHEVGFRPY